MAEVHNDTSSQKGVSNDTSRAAPAPKQDKQQQQAPQQAPHQQTPQQAPQKPPASAPSSGGEKK